VCGNRRLGGAAEKSALCARGSQRASRTATACSANLPQLTQRSLQRARILDAGNDDSIGTCGGSQVPNRDVDPDPRASICGPPWTDSLPRGGSSILAA
jgi:hypothetical protein